MTAEEYDSLPAEEKRIKVAELADWKGVINAGPSARVHEFRGFTPDKTHASYLRWRICIPDYLNDLNACHEFELNLDLGTRGLFRKQLNDIIKPEKPTTGYGERVCHATAEQRCKAFVLTMSMKE